LKSVLVYLSLLLVLIFGLLDLTKAEKGGRGLRAGPEGFGLGRQADEIGLVSQVVFISISSFSGGWS
jgi:hypothetical protein